MTKPKKVLSIFSLVMINVIAVDSLRTLPISAEYGTSIISLYLLAAVIFFIPTALTAAELATGWPNTGGVYVWVREAFGVRAGFLIIWLQWIYNVVWYPTILTFVTATITYLFKPSLADNKEFLLISTLSIFWLSTFINCFGMRISSLVSTLGAIFGTLLPMLAIIILGIIWIMTKHPLQIHFTRQDLLPDFSHIQNLVFFVGVLFGLVGMEMSAVHAGEVKNPQRDYPRALLISTLIIIGTLVFASLAIAIVVPHNDISLVSGLIYAFDQFLTAFHLHWLLPFIVIAIVLGAFAGVSAWIIGPTKGLMVAAEDGCIPKVFQKVNRHFVPTRILLLQGAIFTALCSVFILLPTVNASFWLLSAMTAQLALAEYVGMFAALIRLHHHKAHVKRHFKIPGGTFGIWVVALTGIATCIAAIIVGFFPPAGMQIGSIARYETIMFVGIAILMLPPVILTWFYRGKRFVS